MRRPPVLRKWHVSKSKTCILTLVPEYSLTNKAIPPGRFLAWGRGEVKENTRCGMERHAKPARGQAAVSASGVVAEGLERALMMVMRRMPERRTMPPSQSRRLGKSPSVR